MENSKFVKIVLIILTGVMLVAMGMCGSNTVAAADSNGTNYSDLGAVLNGTNNTTTNNTTTLPKTGIENSTPVIALMTIFAISAIYAYKKIREYKNL